MRKRTDRYGEFGATVAPSTHSLAIWPVSRSGQLKPVAECEAWSWIRPGAPGPLQIGIFHSDVHPSVQINGTTKQSSRAEVASTPCCAKVGVDLLETMTPAQRTERARKAAQPRWAGRSSLQRLSRLEIAAARQPATDPEQRKISAQSRHAHSLLPVVRARGRFRAAPGESRLGLESRWRTKWIGHIILKSSGLGL